MCEFDGGGFVGSYKMKSVNMLDLAKTISNDITIVGNRPGEKVDEDLISENEIPFTYVYDDLILIRNKKNKGTNVLNNSYSSANAEKMNNKELEELVWNTK